MQEKEKFSLWVSIVFACTILFGGLAGTVEKGRAASTSVPDIKIAVVNPLSGVQSRNGNLDVQSIKAAMAWVNDNGGIKSLGGAKLVPVIGDVGGTVEGAASAMDRVCRDPDIVMAIGSWASSFTLASSEITERLGIPLFSHSYADELHKRGFKWGFYGAVPATASAMLRIRLQRPGKR